MKCKLFFLYILIVFVLTGCMTVTDKVGELLDGTVCKEKKISRYKTEKKVTPAYELNIVQNKQKEKSLIITAKAYPMFKLRATFPDNDGIIHFTSLDFLSGNTHGWIEFSLQIFGTGRITFSDTASIKITEKIEPVVITSGKIHRYDTRITDNEALTALTNRRERIAALTQWMNLHRKEFFKSTDEFSNFWKPLILPETVKKKKRPENYPHTEDIFARADDIKWNTSYTERVFPEDFWQVRNSGTLLRDWEEALNWIYLEYEWENIINSINDSVILKKVK